MSESKIKIEIYTSGWDHFNFQIRRMVLIYKALAFVTSIHEGIRILQRENNYKRPQYTNQ